MLCPFAGPLQATPSSSHEPLLLPIVRVPVATWLECRPEVYEAFEARRSRVQLPGGVFLLMVLVLLLLVFCWCSAGAAGAAAALVLLLLVLCW